MTTKLRSYVGGSWRDGVRVVEDINPANPAEVVAEVSMGGTSVAGRSGTVAVGRQLERLGRSRQALQPWCDDLVDSLGAVEPFPTPTRSSPAACC